MLRPLGSQLLAAALAALAFGLLSASPWVALETFVTSAVATGSREPQPFGRRLERALLLGTMFAVGQLYLWRRLGR